MEEGTEYPIGGRCYSPRGKPPKQYGSRRRCIHPDCSTVLSQYNPNDACYAHAPKRYPILRGKYRTSR